MGKFPKTDVCDPCKIMGTLKCWNDDIFLLPTEEETSLFVKPLTFYQDTIEKITTNLNMKKYLSKEK